jgi:hypothetical protein
VTVGKGVRVGSGRGMVVGGWVGMVVWVGVGVLGRTAEVGRGVSMGEVGETAVFVTLAIGTCVASGSSGAQAVRRMRRRRNFESWVVLGVMVARLIW